MRFRMLLTAGMVFMYTASAFGQSGQAGQAGKAGEPQEAAMQEIRLPEAKRSGDMSLEQALNERKSVRSFSDTPLSLEELAQLLWAGNGTRVDAVSGPTRTAPSAGGLYPQELFVFAGDVEGLDAGVYAYRPARHSLLKIDERDRRRELASAALNQRFIAAAPAVIVIGGVVERTAAKYGNRGAERYVYMDAAHSSENIFLQATVLGLATVTVGAFRDSAVSSLLRPETGFPDGLPDARPIYIMPVGRPRHKR